MKSYPGIFFHGLCKPYRCYGLPKSVLNLTFSGFTGTISYLLFTLFSPSHEFRADFLPEENHSVGPFGLNGGCLTSIFGAESGLQLLIAAEESGTRCDPVLSRRQPVTRMEWIPGIRRGHVYFRLHRLTEPNTLPIG